MINRNIQKITNFFWKRVKKNIHRLPDAFLSDKNYAMIRYRATFGRSLNLESPTTFNEKIQWLKLHNRDETMTTLADKYAVRSYVKEKIGEKYLNPLLGVYENYEDFIADIPNLPNEFILKGTHGSGWNQVIKNKESISSETLENVSTWLDINYYDSKREWAYKNIKPRIICEPLIYSANNDHNLTDYKFFCYDGKPFFVQVDVDRFQGHHRNYYDLSWDKLPLEVGFPNFDKVLPQPNGFSEMITIAEKLSVGFNFIRVDLYSEDSIIFGELTFYPDNGFKVFNSKKYALLFGNPLNLN